MSSNIDNQKQINYLSILSNKWTRVKLDAYKALAQRFWNYNQPQFALDNSIGESQEQEKLQNFHIFRAVNSKYFREVGKLPRDQYRVVELKHTEPPFENEYYNYNAKGTYHCVVCDTLLFKSKYKYDSKSGWPAFSKPEETLSPYPDKSHGMMRTEVCCPECNAHLGHVFDDGPKPLGISKYAIIKTKK